MGKSAYGGLGVTVTVDATAISNARRELALIADGINKAIPAAVNKSINRGKTFVIGQLGALLTAKKSAIRATPGGKERVKAYNYGYVQPEAGVIRIMTRAIGAINFELTQDSKGWVVKYFKDGSGANEGGGEPRGQFIGVGMSGNKHLFSRSVLGKRYKQDKAHYKPNIGKLREAISKINGLSLFRVYQSHPELTVDLSRFLTEEFPRQLDSQVDRFLGRKKPQARKPAA